MPARAVADRPVDIELGEFARASGTDERTVLAAATRAVRFRFGSGDGGLHGRLRFAELLATTEPNADADLSNIDSQALECLLRHAISAPSTPIGALRLLPDEAAVQIVAETNAAAGPGAPARLLHEPFERLAAEDPERVALLADDRTVSYGELNRRAERFAGLLSALGAGPERAVGVLLDRSPELVVALLAVLKCGAPFVPLDRRMPPERIDTVLRIAGAGLMIGGEAPGPGVRIVSERDSAMKDAFVAPSTTMDAFVALAPGNAAYIYFTSGSTGVPKGVVLDHSCAAGRVDWIVERYRLGPGAVVLHKTPLIFDVAIIEIMASLSAGATIRIAGPHGEADVEHLAELLGTGEVVFVHFVPSMLKAFLAGTKGARFPAVRWVQTSGEVMPARLLAELRERFSNAEFHSVYGQTETSEVASWEGGDPVDGPHLPIGRQVGSYRLFVLDDALNPVPPGVPGEICVAGVGGLARGYHDQPALTAERFVPNPYAIVPGERLYRTGDLGMYDHFGQIGFAGRTDAQAKIRGARVEPAEVEAVLAGHSSVTECAVLVRRDKQDDNELVAYLTGPGIDVGELAEHAARTLPSFMLPAAYVRLDAFPYTGSGKLDRAALPAPAPADRVVRAAPATERGSPLERELCRLWASILGVESVGPADDFFAMGGNSLMVTQVMIRLKAAFGVRVPVAEFFDDPTVRGLTSLVEQLVGALVAGLSDDEAEQRMEALGR